MAETKSASRSGSKLALNESTMPLLDDEAHEKAETPEKDAIEMKEKASTTSEPEKDDSNPEKNVSGLRRRLHVRVPLSRWNVSMCGTG